MPGIVKQRLDHLSLLELGPHPAHDLQHDPGAGLLEHGHRVTVGDTLQAVSVHRQQPTEKDVMIETLIIRICTL